MSQSPVHSHQVIIPSDWLESKYEHVHHGRCFSILEQGRLSLLEAIGFPNDDLLQEGKGLVITRVEANYKREVKGSEVTVTCERPSVAGRVLTVHQTIRNDRGKVAVEAVIESMFMDLKTRRGMDVPDEFKAAFLRWGAVDTDTDLQ